MKHVIERAATFGIIPISISNRFKRFMKTRGNDFRSSKLGHFEGDEKSGRFEQLLHKAIAEEIIPLDKAADLANVSKEQLKSELQLL